MIKQEHFQIGASPALLLGEPSDRVYLFLHGLGGNKEEALRFGALVCPAGWQVLSVDLPQHGERAGTAAELVPWVVMPELRAVLAYIRAHWQTVGLRANSIGAWFSMQSFAEEPLAQCLFVSPVLDMEALIGGMMAQAGVTEAQLQEQQVIPTTSGQALSWQYLCYAREHPIVRWDSPTALLFAGFDPLTSRETVDAFAARFHCLLTIMQNGEHWFHTPEQLRVLDDWTARSFQPDK